MNKGIGFFIIGLGLFVMLSSCRSSRQVVQQNTTDSIRVEYREVEKIIHIPGDTVFLTMEVTQDPSIVSASSAPVYKPQVQTAETKRSSVRVEITPSGEIKATAICKELEEKVTVLERTISNYKSEVTEYQVKESILVKAKDTMFRWLKGILISLVLLAAISVVVKLGLNPLSIVKKLFKK